MLGEACKHSHMQTASSQLLALLYRQAHVCLLPGAVRYFTHSLMPFSLPLKVTVNPIYPSMNGTAGSLLPDNLWPMSLATYLYVRTNLTYLGPVGAFVELGAYPLLNSTAVSGLCRTIVG